MKNLVITSIAVLGLVSAAAADPTFFVAPSAYPTYPVDASLDTAWQAAVGGNFTELDLDGFDGGADIDSLTAGTIGIDVGLAGVGGSASTAEIFRGSYGGVAGGSYGTVDGGALLNQDLWNGTHSEITFHFSEPVWGFGLWVFDNNAGSPESFRMHVSEDGGTTFHSSGVLESANGNHHFVEGWLGATSTTGITDVSIEVVDANSLDPVQRFFEIDHIQVSPIPAPGALFLGAMGLGLAGWVKRRFA